MTPSQDTSSRPRCRRCLAPRARPRGHHRPRPHHPHARASSRHSWARPRACASTSRPPRCNPVHHSLQSRAPQPATSCAAPSSQRAVLLPSKRHTSATAYGDSFRHTWSQVQSAFQTSAMDRFTDDRYKQTNGGRLRYCLERLGCGHVAARPHGQSGLACCSERGHPPVARAEAAVLRCPPQAADPTASGDPRSP